MTDVSPKIKGVPRFCVYVMADPTSGDVFYVGETNNAQRRKEQHFEGSDQLSGFKVKALKAVGLEPIFQVIEHCQSDEAALMAEISWIRHFISIGAPLLNSQNFDGREKRNAARVAMKGLLSAVTGDKYDDDKLRHVANGKTYHNGAGNGPPHSKCSPRNGRYTPAASTKIKGPLQPWEKQKVHRMNKQGLRDFRMAEILGRDVRDFRQQLRRMS